MDHPISCLYHANCPDGHCAAWLISKVYPKATFIPCQYGDAPPDCTNRVVYIVDFSFPREVMLAIAKQALIVVTLDHHQTAQVELIGLDDEVNGIPGMMSTTVFDMEKSGAQLTWDYLLRANLATMVHAQLQAIGLAVRPWLVDYTADRDLWRFALPESRAINAALFSYPRTFEVWDTLARRDPHGSLVEEGRAIERRDQQVIAEHLARAMDIELGGWRVPCVNATTLFSDIAGELAKGRPFGVCYFDRADGRRQYSLRSDDDGVDVSVVAQQFGGGGHKHAAGFTTEQVWRGFMPTTLSLQQEERTHQARAASEVHNVLLKKALDDPRILGS